MGSKAIFIYSKATGPKSSFHHVKKIIDELSSFYGDLTIRETSGPDDFLSSCVEAASFDEVILYGGDGSFNILCHELSKLDNPPVIGYINGGTLNDCGKPFGIKGSYKNALRIIESKKVSSFDLIKIGDRHFTYMAACGAFSDISYAASRNTKKRIGKLGYYLLAVKKAFKKTRIEVEVDGKKYVTPFLLIMNGDYVGGFHVNKGASNDDGQIEIYIAKPGLFNGLVQYAFRKKKITKLQGEAFRIDFDGPWCIDGEKGPEGPVDVVVERKLRVYSK